MIKEKMSYDSSEWINIGKKGTFSGGYVDNNPNLFLEDQYSPYLRNARLDGATIIKRPGHSLLTTLVGGTYIRGLHYYEGSLYIYNNGKFYNYSITSDTSFELPLITVFGDSDYDDTVANWTSISAGSFKYGTTDITGLDFTSATTFDDILEVIRVGINTTIGITNAVVQTGRRRDNTSLMTLYVGGTETSISAPGSGTDLRTIMGMITNSSTDLTAYLIGTDRTNFINAGDYVYCFGGEVSNSTSRSLFKIEGNLLFLVSRLDLTTDLLPFGFQPKFGVIFNSCMWCGGFTGDIKQNVVYKSVAGDFDDFDGVGSDSFTFGDNITGLSANLEGLFYFTKDTISVTGLSDLSETSGTITYNTRSLTVKEGAVNHNSIVNIGRMTYFLTPSNKICMISKGNSIDGFEVLELSEREYTGISTIMGTLDDDQTDSFGYFLEKENLIKWFVKTNGASTNDLCIIYDITKNAFLIDNNKIFYNGTSDGLNHYTSSMNSLKIFTDEVGVQDESTIINFEYNTKAFYISEPTMKKIIWEVRTLLDINGSAKVTQKIEIDGTLINTKDIEQSVLSGLIETYILITKGNLNRKGRKIQLKFTEKTALGKVRLKNLSIKAEVLPGIATDLT